MPDPKTVDLFVEDLAHEAFLAPLIERVAAESDTEVAVRVRSARGGHGRVLDELRRYQERVEQGFVGLTVPDVLVVAIDTNCRRYAEARKAVASTLRGSFLEKSAIACPDPHVERWYMADPPSFRGVVGAAPKPGKRKCDRALYKDRLARTLAEGGHPTLLGGLEFARDIVRTMDLYRAGKNEKSLKHFLDDVRKAIRRA